MAGLSTNFRPLLKHGHWTLKRLPMKESVAMEKGAAIYTDLAGEHTLVTDSTNNFRGILAEAIAATDSDYATAKKKKYVYVPLVPEAEAEFTVGAGTFTVDDIGKSVKFADSKGLGVDTAGAQARITDYISSTRGKCTFSLAISQS